VSMGGTDCRERPPCRSGRGRHAQRHGGRSLPQVVYVAASPPLEYWLKMRSRRRLPRLVASLQRLGSSDRTIHAR
jgi:hypothetical protein